MKKRIFLFFVVLISLFRSNLVLGSDETNLRKKVEVSGTLRNVEGKGWFVINDNMHEPINIKSVKVTKKGVLIIEFSFNAEKIHTFIAGLDDSLALKGYFVGASVSLNTASIAISRVQKGKVSKIRLSFCI